MKLFTTFHADMSRKKFFGVYLHSITVHAPYQLQIVSLLSVNTENQERIFSQARRSASLTSNRQPQNVLSTTVLRLQAKNKLTDTCGYNGDSRVAKAAANVPAYKGTHIDKEFLKHRSHSWEAHLLRISDYLVPGKGVWWKETASSYVFIDGDRDPLAHPEGPELQHFNTTTIEQVFNKKQKQWEKIIEEETTIPIQALRLSHMNSQTDFNKHPSIEHQSEVHADTTKCQEETEEATTTEERDQLEMDRLREEEPTPEPDRIPFKTRQAQEIASILGDQDKLRQFDKLRYGLKTKKIKPNQQNRAQHEQLLAEFQQAVEKEKALTLARIKELETKYFSNHQQLPTPEQVPELKTEQHKLKHNYI